MLLQRSSNFTTSYTVRWKYSWIIQECKWKHLSWFNCHIVVLDASDHETQGLEHLLVTACAMHDQIFCERSHSVCLACTGTVDRVRIASAIVHGDDGGGVLLEHCCVEWRPSLLTLSLPSWNHWSVCWRTGTLSLLVNGSWLHYQVHEGNEFAIGLEQVGHSLRPCWPHGRVESTEESEAHAWSIQRTGEVIFSVSSELKAVVV